MSDAVSGLTEREIAEMCALADGTLPAERRAEVEARVAASPELQELLERQRVAVTAVRRLAAEEEPASLRAAVEARRREPGSAGRVIRRLTPRAVLAGA